MTGLIVFASGVALAFALLLLLIANNIAALVQATSNQAAATWALVKVEKERGQIERRSEQRLPVDRS